MPPSFPFEISLDDIDQCMVWEGSRTKYGYGKYYDSVEGKRIYDYVHRAAYRFYIGPIPTGMFVLHTCDNPPCWNPWHLFLGTGRDNALDREAKGRGRWSKG